MIRPLWQGRSNEQNIDRGTHISWTNGSDCGSAECFHAYGWTAGGFFRKQFHHASPTRPASAEAAEVGAGTEAREEADRRKRPQEAARREMAQGSTAVQA